MKVLRLTHLEGCESGDAYCIYDAEEPALLLEEVKEMQYCEVGEEWQITVEEMSREIFASLPEFTGW